MGEEQPKKAESEAASLPAPAEEQPPVKEGKESPMDDVSKEKTVTPGSEKVADERSSRGSTDREAELARVETEKRFSLIKAWEENEKAKIENKAHKKLAAIGSWENTKKVSVEMQLKKLEEKMERKKAEYAEKTKNRAAEIHKAAEERRAMIEAKRGEDVLKIRETADKFRASGYKPKKLLGCFSS